MNWKNNWTKDNALGSSLGLVSGLGNLITSNINPSNEDPNELENNIIKQLSERNNNRLVANSTNDLLSMWNSNTDLVNNYTTDDFYNGPSGGDILKNSVSSTLEGAQAGLAAGPFGALAGAVVGLGAGLGSSLSAKSKAEKQAKESLGNVTDAINMSNNIQNAKFNLATNNLNQQNYRNLMANINAFGGTINGNGTNFTNGLTFINEGGTHEQNPYNGVPMGIAQDGKPNLVEEGEVVWDNYVFSNRLTIPTDIKNKYKLNGKNLTYAEAVKKLQKSSSERPNDPIEKRGLNNILSVLAQSQEAERQKQEQENAYNQAEDTAAMFADGGTIEIAKNKRGTFTAAATKNNMGVQEFANHVLANKDKYSTNMVRKAVFAHNANSWKYALGGHLGLFGMNLNEDHPPYVTMSPGTVPYWGEPTEGVSNYEVPVFKAEEGPYKDIPVYYPTELHYQGNLPSEGSDYEDAGDYITTYNQPIVSGEEINVSKEYKPILDWLSSNPSNPSNPSGTPKTKNKTKFDESWLRYAPVLGSTIGAITSLFDKPDMEYADAIERASRESANNLKDVSYKPIGDYLAYNPMDRLFAYNQLSAQNAALNRNISGNANGNRGAAMSGLLAANYNANNALGQAFKQAEEFNLAQRQAVNNFNRGTNQANSQMDLQSQIANAQTAAQRAQLINNAILQTAALRLNEKNRVQESRNLNLTNLFDNLGDIGWEAVNRNMINDNDALLYSFSRNGMTPYKGFYSKEQWDKLSEDAKNNIASQTGRTIKEIEAEFEANNGKIKGK